MKHHGIVHGAAEYLPDFCEYFGTVYESLHVKIGSLTSKQDIETMNFGQYRQKILESYQNGTYRYGPSMSISLVGRKQEECGMDCGQMLDLLESCPFLKPILPWGDLSITKMSRRTDSYDGPIMWIRPGEQLIPTDQLPKASQNGGRK
uniref:Uncharacterized protein n=1 Tax=Romanomermis culicivorax TaxID=13658 RepID=A0A915HZ52_ROMCU